jgi:hypothetical protein
MRLGRSLAGYADVLGERNWITLSILAARLPGLTGAAFEDASSGASPATCSAFRSTLGILTPSECGR